MKYGDITREFEKYAFVPNPQLMQQMQGQGAPSQAQPQDPSQMQGQPGQDPSQGMDPNMLAQMQAAQEQGNSGQQDPSQDPAQSGSGVPSDLAELKNTKVTLSIESLLDLVSSGKASQSRLRTEQMKSKHEQKMQQDQQKQQQAEQDAQAQQQMQQQGMMQGGGIYPQPLNQQQPQQM